MHWNYEMIIAVIFLEVKTRKKKRSSKNSLSVRKLVKNVRMIHIGKFRYGKNSTEAQKCCRKI